MSPSKSPITIPRAPMMSFFMSAPYLEPVVQIHEEGVDGEGRAFDLVRARPFDRGPQVLAYPEVASQDPALGIRPALVKIGIGEGVEHRVRFEVLVVAPQAPLPAVPDVRIAHGEAGKVPLRL